MKVAILITDNREHLKDYTNPTPHFGTAPEALLQGFAQLPEAEIHVISCVRKPMVSPEKLADNIWYHPVLVNKIGWISTAYQGCIRAVRKKLREIGPDIVHGQGTERECAISAVFSGYPNVVTIHGNMAEINRLFPAPSVYLRIYQRLVSWLEDLSLSRTGGVFCHSDYTASVVEKRARRTWMVPNPLRAAFFREPGSGISGLIQQAIINVGAISPRKRQLEILKTAENLHHSGHTVPFLFVGSLSQDNDYGRAFKAQIEKAEAEGYAFYLGVKKIDELIDVFDQAGAMVHFPSEEGFGLVVAEALARNLKFFGSSVGGIVDIASGIEAAELFPPNDWSALHKGIVQWLRSGHPKPSHASEEIALRYHPKVIALRHLEIYREVLNTSS